MHEENKIIQKKVWEQFGLGIEIVPVIIGLMVVVGTIYINAYYYYGYDFKVATYLDISEILLLSFVDLGQLLETIKLAFLLIAMVYLFLLLNKWRGSKNTMTFNEVSTSGSIPIIISELFFKSNKPLPVFILCLVTALVFYILSRLNFKIRSGTGVISLISLIFLETGIGNYDLISKYHYSFGTTLVTEKDTLVADSSYYYAGKTRNYVFWYNEKDSAMTVIPMNDVKKLIIHNGEPDKKSLNTSTNKAVKLVRIVVADTTKKLQKK